MSINDRICEGMLCEDMIGDFSMDTAEWRQYGPYKIELTENEQELENICIQFEASGYFPHIQQFKIIPMAVYNLSSTQSVLKCINFLKLKQQNDDEKQQHKYLDVTLKSSLHRQSIRQSKKYHDFLANILFYDHSSNRMKPTRCSDNMKITAADIHCDGKNGFVEYEINGKSDQNEIEMALGIEYSSGDKRPLECFINNECVLKGICDEIVNISYDEAAKWRMYKIKVKKQSFPILFRLQTNGYFPHIHSMIIMPITSKQQLQQNDNNDETSNDNPYLDGDLMQTLSKYSKEANEQFMNEHNVNSNGHNENETFLKLATIYRDFITLPSDLNTFGPLINSVRNICFDTYNDDNEIKSETDNDNSISFDNETFVPDDSFYASRNVDGLWICVSRNCENYAQILDEATFLVKSFIPIRIRRLFLKYKHGRYRPKYVGPMRLIILSHSIDEQAGCIPELKNDETGRNGTAQPFVFSSSDDFNRGFFNCAWFNGQLTAHELVHAVDMIIRQLIDPCFMVELDNVYNLAKESGVYPDKCYAMTSKHEYIAEILTVFMNIPPKDLYDAGFRNKNDLKKKDCAGYGLLQKWFLELDHTLPVLDVYKKCNN